jgi:NADH-quinone oxidoreductase subunit L
MTLPLVILAFLAVIGGFIGIPQWIMGEHAHPIHLNLMVAATSTAVAVAGIILGTLLYRNAKTGEDPVKKILGGFYGVIVNKFYLDHFFTGAGRLVSQSLARLLFWFDWNVVIEKGVNGAARLTTGTASLVRKAQTGRIETYAMAFAAGVVALVFYAMLRA